MRSTIASPVRSRLLRRVDADDDERAGAAKAVERGRRDLVGVGRRAAARAAHAHAVGAVLLDRHLAEVADHVGQHVGAGVADLVEQLLGDRARAITGRRCPRGLVTTKLPSARHSTIG